MVIEETSGMSLDHMALTAMDILELATDMGQGSQPIATTSNELKRRRLVGSLGRESLGRESLFSSAFNVELGCGTPVFPSPSSDLAHLRAIEQSSLCDFSCCGTALADLHALLFHFEENHVKIDSDCDDFDLFEFDSDDDTLSYLKHQNPQTQAVALSDIQTDPRLKPDTLRKIPFRQNRYEQEEPNTIPPHQDGPTPVNQIQPSPQKPIKKQKPVAPEPLKVELEVVDEVDKDLQVRRGTRPYKCKINGCPKAYKNPGGLKYHMQHGHCQGNFLISIDTGDPDLNQIMHKPYQCTVDNCGKRYFIYFKFSYKNLNGLKYHIEHAHSSLLATDSVLLEGLEKAAIAAAEAALLASGVSLDMDRLALVENGEKIE
jgi:hypothetical protein